MHRGAALILALFALFVVTTSAALVAEGMTRRMRVARQQLEQVAWEDLERSGRALLRVKARDGAWIGPETVELAGGSVTVRRGPGDAGEITCRARISGRERTFSASPR